MPVPILVTGAVGFIGLHIVQRLLALSRVTKHVDVPLPSGYVLQTSADVVDPGLKVSFASSTTFEDGINRFVHGITSIIQRQAPCLWSRDDTDSRPGEWVRLLTFHAHN